MASVLENIVPILTRVPMDSDLDDDSDLDEALPSLSSPAAFRCCARVANLTSTSENILAIETPVPVDDSDMEDDSDLDEAECSSGGGLSHACEKVGTIFETVINAKCRSLTRATASQASSSTAAGDTDILAASPFSENRHDLQHCEAEEARREFAATLSIPGLRDVLQAECTPRGSDTAFAWDQCPAQSLSQIAMQCAIALRTLTPRILAAVDSKDGRQLATRCCEQHCGPLHQGDKKCRENEPQVEDGAAASRRRVAQLESELRRAREASCAKDGVCPEDEREAALDRRCRSLERDAQDTQSAIESSLQEKEYHLEEKCHLVDRRVVSSMLASYLDHQRSGDHKLSEQVLDQIFQVLGTERASIVADRTRIRATTGQTTKPLSSAFLDFLAHETAEPAGTDLAS